MGFKHVARIRKGELRAVGLQPKSDRVIVTDKIRAKLEGRGLKLELVRRVIEDGEYQRRSPRSKSERAMERYKWIEGAWYIAVVYVPSPKEEQKHNSLATCHLISKRKVDRRLDSGVLQARGAKTKP